MKISEFIEYLEKVKSCNGDIDVLCVSTGMSQSWETAIPNQDSNAIFDTDSFYKKFHDIETDKFLFIGINA